ncbi:hypothetical protein KAT73_04305, partial [candidate division WOR-3 bacterium]|nr:hypothetical protein [candidate division WOR-3 bacterium]
RERFLRLFSRKRQDVELLENRIIDLSPISVLKRGYSICFKLPEEKVVSNSNMLTEDDYVRIKFSKGSTDARIEKVMMNED